MLLECLEAARMAPSACNSQPWHFIVIENKELKDRICKKAFSGIYSLNSFAKDAPVLVVVVRENSKYIAKLGGYFRGTQYCLIDIGIACQHFILKAEELGLGTCWLGWFNERAIKSILNLPKDKKIDIIISVGYPGSNLKQVQTKRRKPLTEICEFM